MTHSEVPGPGGPRGGRLRWSQMIAQREGAVKLARQQTVVVAQAARDLGISETCTPAAARRHGVHSRPKTQEQRAQSTGPPSCWHGGCPERPSGSAMPGISLSAATSRHMRTRTLMVKLKPSPGRLSGWRLRPMARAAVMDDMTVWRSGTLRSDIGPPASLSQSRTPPRPAHDSLCQVPTVICQHLNMHPSTKYAIAPSRRPGDSGI